MTARRSALVLALALALVPADAAGQRSHARDGFWIGFGLGLGGLTCDDCENTEQSGSGYLRLGGTVNPKLLLGFEANVWAKERLGVTLSHGNYGAAVYFYPSETGGFFLKGGLGVATLRLDVGPFGDAQVTGGGAVFGLGWDGRTRSDMALRPLRRAGPYGLPAPLARNGGST